ncbi:MAG: enoyl-CoA hydratase/isomerase family protein [Cupriavidus sp.]|uniref:enoyl-CoA hydratase/isomerase family protein n=1 Tax=Cupriavidus pauculus TaxID=82633 RepID=UPI000785BC1E|nr:enoyl-CoA hydratase/isomerase family protein [Cupriavidus pauculus]KAB0601717.1 enoyl-CoA hydratase/isomerase family protein [Cupriavidus pauculus]MBU70109.1 enoyl-CoA hydratase/isomerase family protein [Cupriavidus sp.]MBY4730975.1 enoyl-CoA hydratase/isomerase family protein [Cupriavidus pauculus]UAL02048.1 enoyl-CoA hydratase/isomerase family protein [Cupriavidus pauculus]
MATYIKTERSDAVGILTLNRPERLNAWNTAMRGEILVALAEFAADDTIGAIVMTGAGERAFSAGQDLEEAHDFDEERAEVWLREWETFYDTLRSLPKPLVMALNGTAAGSAFQVTLLGDIRVAHRDVQMGQPEINAGIASVTGPWIMNEMLGMSRTIELTLTGRMMMAQECFDIGLVHHLVPREQVLERSLSIAADLAAKPRLAMRLDKAWLREMTEQRFRESINAGIRIHRESYASGEPARMMEAFFEERARRRAAASNA